MELFIFILLLSLMSFSVAFLVYGFCLRFFGASGTKSKIDLGDLREGIFYEKEEEIFSTVAELLLLKHIRH